MINCVRRYQLTEDGFRQKFKTSKQEPGETVGQLAVRLSNYLIRRMDIVKVQKTYDEDLRDLILRKQLLVIVLFCFQKSER